MQEDSQEATLGHEAAGELVGRQKDRVPRHMSMLSNAGWPCGQGTCLLGALCSTRGEGRSKRRSRNMGPNIWLAWSSPVATSKCLGKGTKRILTHANTLLLSGSFHPGYFPTLFCFFYVIMYKHFSTACSLPS